MAVRRLWRQLSVAVLDAVLPTVCSACGESGSGLCRPCRMALEGRPQNGCPRCGESLLPGGRCQEDHRALRHLTQLLFPFRFAGTGGSLVRRFKLDGDASAGRRLARAMADEFRMRSVVVRPLIVSVPLHRARRRRRGFDQAAWLASRVGERLGLRAASGVLVRRRATRPQGDAQVRSRSENVRGAFAVRASERLAGRDVLLVDDVMTTGATARACAGLLKAAGARSVVLLVGCRS